MKPPAKLLRVHFINSISRHKFGGGEKWMVSAARGLTERGHKVWVSGKDGSEFLQRARQAGVTTQAFNIRMDVSPGSTNRIRRFLQENQVDVLVCNLNKDVRVAGLAARLARTPAVIARHGVLLCGPKRRHRFTLTRLVDGILTNTETIKSAYLAYGWFEPDFIQVIYNGIPDKRSIKPYDFSQKFPGKKIIVSAGRLSEQKGFDLLITAAERLRKSREDLCFVVFGRGRLENELKALADARGLSESFHFFGYAEDLDPYISGCDLFVLSSRFEGMPNVVMEAMALGKCVVATDINGVRELMIDGQTGLIVPAESPPHLAEAISRLIDDTVLLNRYGEAGRQRVRRHFTGAQMILNLEAYFIAKCQDSA